MIHSSENERLCTKQSPPNRPRPQRPATNLKFLHRSDHHRCRKAHSNRLDTFLPTLSFRHRRDDLDNLSLLWDAALALIEVGSSTSSGADTGKVSSWVGAGLDDGSAAGGTGADQVEGALCEVKY